MLLQISYSQKKIVADPIDFQFRSYDTTEIEDYSNRILVKIILDFNNDGIDDIAISDTYTWGNAGGDWDIYLGKKDGKYEYFDVLFFHPLAFKVHPQKYGTSTMIIYRRAGGGEGDLIEYSISNSGIKEVKSRIMKPDNESEADYVEYWKLFGDLYKNPKSTCCRLSEYLKDKNCKWYPGYDIENK
jgi:hypothetical protein